MAVSKIIAGADAEITLKMDVKMELFQFPAGGDGARNISEWLDMSVIEWNTTVMEDDQERNLTPEEREERVVHEVKFALRATIVSDCKTAAVYVLVIPVGAREVKTKISTLGGNPNSITIEIFIKCGGGAGECVLVAGDCNTQWTV